MKKSIAAFFLSLLCVSVVTPQTTMQVNAPARSDREANNLRGLVETIRYEWCMLSEKPNQFGEYTELKHNHVKTITFDIAGNEVLRDPPAYFCATSAMIEANQKHEHKYDEYGRVLEVKTSWRDGRLKFRTTFEYDSQGRVTALASYGADGNLQYKWQHVFDADGNEIKTLHYWQGGRFSDVLERKFNDRGQVIEASYFNGDGSFRSKTVSTYEYDIQGNWIKSIDSELIIKGEKSFYKPSRIDYRFITYHSDADLEKNKQKVLDEQNLPKIR